MDSCWQLKDKVKDHRYEEALSDIEAYFAVEENEINPGILIQYVNCLHGLGYFEEARKQLRFIEENYPDTSKRWLIESYILSNDIKKAKTIMEDTELDLSQLLTVAKAYYFVGYYDDAYEVFDKIWKESDDDYLRSYAVHFNKTILDYRLNKQFIKIDYRYYKLHNKLSPGDVFYMKIENDIPREERKYRRPMMVWKVEGEDVYAFPLTKKTTRKDGRLKGYLIRCDKYRNFDGNRSLKYDMVKVQEKDINRLVERIDNYDYMELLRSAYSTIHRIGTKDVYEASAKFLNEFDYYLYPDSIVDTFDENRNKKYYYLKTADDSRVNGQCYELDLVDHTFLVKDGILKKIPDTELVISSSKLSHSLKEDLELQIKSKQKVKVKRPNNEN